MRFFRGALSAEVVAYLAEVYDDIFFVQPPETRAGFFQNLERTRRAGLELALSARPLRHLELYGNLTYTRATFQTTATLWAPYLDDDDDDLALGDDDLEPPTVRPGDHFPMVPAWRGALGASYTAGGWRLGMELTHVGSQWLRGDEDNREEDEKLEAYTLVHARLERDFRRATFFARVENLLDAEYNTFGVLALSFVSRLFRNQSPTTMRMKASQCAGCRRPG